MPKRQELVDLATRVLLGAEWPSLGENAKLLARARLPVVMGAEAGDQAGELLLKEAQRNWDEEADRRKRLEAKATSLLAAVTVTTTIALALLLSALRGELYAAGATGVVLRKILVGLTTLGVLQFVLAAYAALRALQRAVYSVPYLSDYGTVRAPGALRRAMAARYLRSAFQNMPGTNYKADWVTLAQALILRGVTMVALAASLAGADYCFFEDAPPPAQEEVPPLHCDCGSTGSDDRSADRLPLSLLDAGARDIATGERQALIDASSLGLTH